MGNSESVRPFLHVPAWNVMSRGIDRLPHPEIESLCAVGAMCAGFVIRIS